VTCGEAVVAMVLNALGFVDRPLYMPPEFLATKPVELLIGEGLKAECFNDDVLGEGLGETIPSRFRGLLSCVLLPMRMMSTEGDSSTMTPLR